MPTYCYRDIETGEIHEVAMSMRDRESFETDGVAEIDGRKVERCFQAEFGRQHHADGLWPIQSNALGVHPDQVDEAKEYYAQHNVPTDFTADGQCILRDRGHRKEVLRLTGMHDNDGGYGD